MTKGFVQVMNFWLSEIRGSLGVFLLGAAVGAGSLIAIHLTKGFVR